MKKVRRQKSPASHSPRWSSSITLWRMPCKNLDLTSSQVRRGNPASHSPRWSSYITLWKTPCKNLAPTPGQVRNLVKPNPSLAIHVCHGFVTNNLTPPPPHQKKKKNYTQKTKQRALLLQGEGISKLQICYTFSFIRSFHKNKNADKV